MEKHDDSVGSSAFTGALTGLALLVISLLLPPVNAWFHALHREQPWGPLAVTALWCAAWSALGAILAMARQGS